MRTTLCFNCAVTFRPCQMYYCYCTSRQLQWQEHDLGYLVVWKKFIRYNCSKLMCTCTYISTGDILARLPVNPHLAPRGSLQNHTCTLTPQPTWPAKHTWQITRNKVAKAATMYLSWANPNRDLLLFKSDVETSNTECVYLQRKRVSIYL